MATTLTQAEFERQFGADTIRRAFDDDGDGEADAALVMHTLERADALALGILMKGGSLDWARAILADDIAARGYAYEIAAGMMGLRRPEFLNAVSGNGGSLYEPAAKAARKELERIADAEIRSRSEATVGANAHVATRVRPSPARRVFTGTETTRNRPRGGF